MTTMRTACPVWTRLFVFAASLATVLGAGLVPQPSQAKAASRNAEDLLIVDCLLPGQSVCPAWSTGTPTSSARRISTRILRCCLRLYAFRWSPFRAITMRAGRCGVR